MSKDEYILSQIASDVFAGIPEEKMAHVKGNVTRYLQKETPALYESISEGIALTQAQQDELEAAVRKLIAMKKELHEKMRQQKTES